MVDPVAETPPPVTGVTSPLALAETILRTSLLLNAELDLDRLVQRITDEATALCGAAFGAFFYNVTNVEGESYTLYTLSGVPREAFAKFPMPRNTAIFAPTFRGDGVVRSDDITQDARYGKNAPHRGMPEGHLPVKSYLAVPVVSRTGEVLGGLFFGHPQRGRFGPPHETLLLGVAAHASIAIDNARLYQKAVQAEEAAKVAREVEARRAREALLRADVGAAISRGSLETMLHRCAEAIVVRLGVAFARIWTLDARGEWLTLRASAGLYTHLDGAHARIPVGAYKIGLIADERRPHLTNDVPHDPRVSDHEWAAREGMVGFAGYPLVIEERLVGVVAAFARKPFSLDVLELLASVADLIAFGIDRDRAERAREELIAALAATNAELDQFAYVTSHDLKAPLRAIGNLAAWLEEDLAERLDDPSREHLNLLKGRVERLERLIDGILSYSRAGRVREKAERVDVGALLAEVIELLGVSPPAEVKVIGAMPTVVAERVPLQQVFLNLLGNALKYGGSGVRVTVTAREVEGLWEFAVTDDGPGIAPQFHERIWGIFQTLAPRDRVESTGIGLSVVRKIVETRGGRVGVRSALGEGATFWFTWRKAP